MTKRLEVAPTPAPLEAYATSFDPWFKKSNQRESFWHYLEGLLLPSERHKMLTGLVNTEPVEGAQLPRAQKLQWVLSESAWADERVYYPVDVIPYTPKRTMREKGKDDTRFHTKLKLAVELVRQAVQATIPFRAVVADSFYGEDEGVRQGLQALGVGYVLALKPSHTWWH